MESCRYINASLGGDDLTIHARASCPQGGVLPPILWCSVVNSLLENLKSLNLFCIGYGDNVVIVVRSKFISTISNIIRDSVVWKSGVIPKVFLLIHRRLQ